MSRAPVGKPPCSGSPQATDRIAQLPPVPRCAPGSGRAELADSQAQRRAAANCKSVNSAVLSDFDDDGETVDATRTLLPSVLRERGPAQRGLRRLRPGARGTLPSLPRRSWRLYLTRHEHAYDYAFWMRHRFCAAPTARPSSFPDRVVLVAKGDGAAW